MTISEEPRDPDDDCCDLPLTIAGSYVLAKANYDKPYNYAVRLKTGECFRFEGCKVEGDWVLFEEPVFIDGFFIPEFRFDRGIEVRLDQIAWIADSGS